MNIIKEDVIIIVLEMENVWKVNANAMKDGAGGLVNIVIILFSLNYFHKQSNIIFLCSFFSSDNNYNNNNNNNNN